VALRGGNFGECHFLFAFAAPSLPMEFDVTDRAIRTPFNWRLVASMSTRQYHSVITPVYVPELTAAQHKGAELIFELKNTELEYVTENGSEQVPVVEVPAPCPTIKHVPPSPEIPSSKSQVASNV